MKIAVALLAAASLGSVAAADVIDQNQPLNDVYMAGFAQGDLAQSFQTQSAPNITGAGIQLMDFGVGGQGNVTISLWDALPNQGGTQMASGTALGVDGQWVDVSWAPVNIAANTTYFLVFTSDNNAQGIYGSVLDPYQYGDVYANSGFQHFPGFDYTFRTWTVPAPSALGVLGIAGLAAARRRR